MNCRTFIPGEVGVYPVVPWEVEEGVRRGSPDVLELGRHRGLGHIDVVVNGGLSRIVLHCTRVSIYVGPVSQVEASSALEFVIAGIVADPLDIDGMLYPFSVF